ncbi:MAG: CDP-alcohol phosphatidyltransferase family protein [Candidatus Thermoplasmatota archaeon]
MQRLMIKYLSYADMVSVTNAIFGFLSILMLALNEFRYAYSFILIALMADGLDGILARTTGKGKLGGYLESMADMTSMSIAPSFFIFQIYTDILKNEINLILLTIGILFVFISFCIIRLAAFHLMKDKSYFFGLPASASAIIIIILSYLKIDLIFVLFIVLLLSFLLISNIPFPKTDTSINIIAVVLILLNLIMGKNYNGIAPIILLAAIFIYSSLGPLYISLKKA